jgi:hypothetical protein
MSDDDLDDVFPTAPTPIRKAKIGSFDDPTVRAKWEHVNDDLPAWHEAQAELAECTAPMACEIGQYAHRLTICSHHPYHGEMAYAFGRAWAWDGGKHAWERMS